MVGEQALKQPVLQLPPSLSRPEAPPQEDLLLLGETEAGRARLPMFVPGHVPGRSASEPSAPRSSASALAPDSVQPTFLVSGGGRGLAGPVQDARSWREEKVYCLGCSAGWAGLAGLGASEQVITRGPVRLSEPQI